MIEATDLQVKVRLWANDEWHWEISGEAAIASGLRMPIVLATSAMRTGTGTRSESFCEAVLCLNDFATDNVPVTVSLHTINPIVAEYLERNKDSGGETGETKRNGST